MDEFITRLIEDLGARVTGPMHLRLYLQPAMATIFAVRAGLQDARRGNGPFFWSLFTGDPDQRRYLLKQGWKDVGKVFTLAVILDAVYQFVSGAGARPLELLIVAVVLAFLPYLLVRGLVTRIARMAGMGAVPATRPRL